MRHNNDVERTRRRRALAGAAFGNGIEWYDFAVYGYLAVYVGKVFFPTNGQSSQLLATFGIFGVSFLARPLGALFFGPLSDRIGRKQVLILVLSLMAASTTAIGVVPSFDAIGGWAPLLLVTLRLLQGFSAGGEFGSASTFMAEHAHPRRRGFGLSWMPFSGTLGLMIGGGLATALATIVGDASMVSWGWRIPFLLAAPLGAVALIIRLQLEDTPEFRAITAVGMTATAPVRSVLGQPRLLSIAAGIAVLYGVGFYMVLTYLTTYIRTVAKQSAGVALFAVLIGGLASLILLPLYGIMTDRIGRRPVLFASSIGILIASYPLFWWISRGPLIGIVAGTAALAALQSGFLGTALVTVSEIFPASMRGTGMALSVNIPVALTGGMAPFAATYLIAITGNHVSPALYLMAAAAISLVAVAAMPTLAPRIAPSLRADGQTDATTSPAGPFEAESA